MTNRDLIAQRNLMEMAKMIRDKAAESNDIVIAHASLEEIAALLERDIATLEPQAQGWALMTGSSAAGTLRGQQKQAKKKK